MHNLILKQNHVAAAQGKGSISSSLEENTVLNHRQQSLITSKVMSLHGSDISSEDTCRVEERFM